MCYKKENLGALIRSGLNDWGEFKKMEKRIFGNTGMPVTVLGFGAMELRNLDQAGAAVLLNRVLDSGINYIDTSPDYGPSEDYIGKGIAHRRSEYFLASKCGCNIDVQGRYSSPPHIWSRAKLMENVENSLRLLKTDHLDVWQLHGPLPEELPGGAQDDVIRAMQEIKQQGKVRAMGISFKNGGASDPLYPTGYSVRYAPHFLGFDVFDMMQIVYGGLVRASETVISQAAEKGLGTVIRGVVKKYYDHFPRLIEQAHLPELYTTGETTNEFLIRFALSHPGIHTLIIGTKSAAHLAENVSAAEKGKLSEDAYAEAKHRLENAGVKAG
jgi:aryl-alcohol dehydrogenase-like predicted oxidoreductase